MKKLKFTFTALVIALSSISASAGTGSGKIKTIISTVGAVMFTIESPSKVPACSIAGEFAIDGSTSDGKNAIAFLLSAASQGRPIFVMGSGNCSLTGSRETVVYVGGSY